MVKTARVGNTLFSNPSADPLVVFNEVCGSFPFVAASFFHLSAHRSVSKQFFALVFLEFERFYTKCIEQFLSTGGNPAFAIMEFNAICKKYFTELTVQIDRGQFDDVLGRRLNTASTEDDTLLKL